MTSVPPSGPPPAPSRRDIKAQQDFQQLVAGSLPVAQASAKAWGSAVAVLVGLFSSVLFISGPEKAADMSWSWRVAVTALLVSGLVCALSALWAFLSIDAGRPGALTFEQFQRDYGSLEVFNVALAKSSAERISKARWRLVAGLIGLALASVTWLMSSPPPSTTNSVTVDIRTGSRYCGVLQQGDATTVALKVEGLAEPLLVPYADIERMLPMAGGC